MSAAAGRSFFAHVYYLKVENDVDDCFIDALFYTLKIKLILSYSCSIAYCACECSCDTDGIILW